MKAKAKGISVKMCSFTTMTWACRFCTQMSMNDGEIFAIALLLPPLAQQQLLDIWQVQKNLRFVHSNKNVSIILWGMPVICGKANLCKKWQPNLKSRRFYAPPHSRPVAFLKLIKTCRWKENLLSHCLYVRQCILIKNWSF